MCATTGGATAVLTGLILNEIHFRFVDVCREGGEFNFAASLAHTYAYILYGHSIGCKAIFSVCFI